MEHLVTVRLTDDEYTMLVTKAEQTGKEPEILLRELLDESFAKHTQPMRKSLRSPSQQKVSEILYRAGLTASIPTGETLSAEEEAELKRLADLLGPGKPASEMVIEDRGPY